MAKQCESHDSSRDSLIENSAFNNTDSESMLEEDLIDPKLEKTIMDPESRKWYKRVLRWTSENRRAYCYIKLIQLLITLFAVSGSVYFYLKFQRTIPDHTLMVTVKIFLAVLVMDVIIFLNDMVTACKRWKTMIMLRFILSAASFAMGVTVQVSYGAYLYDQKGSSITTILKSSITRFVVATIAYIWTCYMIWIIINLFMYFQILEMEHKEKKQLNQMKKISTHKASIRKQI
jgi:hypothetical protein